MVITGANGTIGSALRKYLTTQSQTIIPWDRKTFSVNNYHAAESFLRSTEPVVLFHLAIASQPIGIENESWLINSQWPTKLAHICNKLHIKFIFTSSVMVFSDKAQGPFTIKSIPDAESGYGYEKRKAEQKVFEINPKAIVARLGWQIGEKSGSNNMIDYLEKQMSSNGKIIASRKWLPACSFISDTAKSLTNLLKSGPGLYMIDSNQRWNFYEICCALNKLHGNKWIVESTEDFVFDQRMIDDRMNIPLLKDTLKDLC